MTRPCQTPGCLRTPAPNYAECDSHLGRLITASFGPPPTPRVVVERLSERDPMCAAIAAEKRGGRAA